MGMTVNDRMRRDQHLISFRCKGCGGTAIVINHRVKVVHGWACPVWQYIKATYPWWEPLGGGCWGDV